MGGQVSKGAAAATTADLAAQDAEMKTASAREVVNEISGVVFEQERAIQQGNATNDELRQQIVALKVRKNQYKALCKKNGLI